MGTIRRTLLTVGGVLGLASSADAQAAPERPDTAPRPAEAVAPAHRASVEYGYVHLSGGADAWHQVTGELSRKTRPVTLVGRVNLAERFGESGAQVEADAYPRISERLYGYLNAGYSRAEIFPEWRLGAELYGNAGGGWEASAGFRRLEFTEEGVTLLTGSVGRYLGSWYFSARPYVTPGDEETSVSGTVLARRYYGDGRSFATLVAGAGTAPTEAPIQFELQRANTVRLAAYGTAALRRRLGLRWSLGWEKEELTEATDRTRINAGIGAEVAF